MNDREAWHAVVHGVTQKRVRHNLATEQQQQQQQFHMSSTVPDTQQLLNKCSIERNLLEISSSSSVQD